MNPVEHIHTRWKSKRYVRVVALKWLQSNSSHSMARHNPIPWISPPQLRGVEQLSSIHCLLQLRILVCFVDKGE